MIIIDNSMDSEVVDVAVGDQIEINLPGNPTTGYEWMLVGVDEIVLKSLGEPQYQSEYEAVGAGGIYVFRFEAIGPGETSVKMEYRRPFESEDTPPAETFELFVKVR